jgi:hypothetical protein
VCSANGQNESKSYLFQSHHSLSHHSLFFSDGGTYAVFLYSSSSASEIALPPHTITTTNLSDGPNNDDGLSTASAAPHAGSTNTPEPKMRTILRFFSPFFLIQTSRFFARSQERNRIHCIAVTHSGALHSILLNKLICGVAHLHRSKSLCN